MRYGASRESRKRHEALRCVTERHDIKRHERHEGGIMILLDYVLCTLRLSFCGLWDSDITTVKVLPGGEIKFRPRYLTPHYWPLPCVMIVGAQRRGFNS